MTSPFHHAALIAAALLAGAAGPVTAPAGTAGSERPLTPPSRDAVLGYHMRPATGEAIDVRVLVRAGGTGLRVDLPDTSYVLVAFQTKEVALVVPLEQTAAEMHWAEGPQALFTLDERARYTRRAEMTVAGQRCTQWDSEIDRERHTLCVTPDGLVLRNQFQDPQGRRNLVEAFAVRYESLADADFQVPKGFERISPDSGPARTPTR